MAGPVRWKPWKQKARGGELFFSVAVAMLKGWAATKSKWILNQGALVRAMGWSSPGLSGDGKSIRPSVFGRCRGDQIRAWPRTSSPSSRGKHQGAVESYRSTDGEQSSHQPFMPVLTAFGRTEAGDKSKSAAQANRSRGRSQKESLRGGRLCSSTINKAIAHGRTWKESNG